MKVKGLKTFKVSMKLAWSKGVYNKITKKVEIKEEEQNRVYNLTAADKDSAESQAKGSVQSLAQSLGTSVHIINLKITEL